MELQYSKKDLERVVSIKKSEGKKIGFVPTMGALHEGHLSLVRNAGQVSDFVIVSIFVNPTQFNNENDLVNYPRTLDVDLSLLKESCCDMVFVPSIEEMYPEPDTRKFNFGSLETVMEGVHRFGHFNGVAQVVSKLFDIVQPDMAFFGEKDFQQLAIIRNMAMQLNYNIEIIGCSTVREKDGLAMSSRNTRLSAEQRKNATLISKSLVESKRLVKNKSVEYVKDWVIKTINSNPFLETEYFEIVDSLTLQPVTSWDESVNNVGCVAVHCGQVRLIDNITF